MGVFQVKNNVNGKILLGSGSAPESKMGRIRIELNNNSYFNRSLQEDWLKYGAENFEFTIIDRLEPIEGQSLADSLVELEVMLELWLEKLAPYGEKGYNRIKK
jgi:hypothetical protein